MCWPASANSLRALAADGVLPAGIDLARVVVEPTREGLAGEWRQNSRDGAGHEPRQSHANSPNESRPMRADDLMAFGRCSPDRLHQSHLKTTAGPMPCDP